MLVGRPVERAIIDKLLRDADYAVDVASDFRVVASSASSRR